MKDLCLLALMVLLSLPSFAQAQPDSIDPKAIMILDKMSSMIGDLNSCSFKLHTANDVVDESFFVPDSTLRLIKKFNYHSIYMQGPHQMMVNSRGDNGHKGYWYDSTHLVFLNYSENNFAYMPAPDNIIDLIHEIHDKYHIDFPAGDFFYPSFVDDLIEHSYFIRLLGTSWVENKVCFHIAALGPESAIQIWVSDDALNLPVKYVIVDLTHEDRPQYEGSFKDWELNPVLPTSLFEFFPPPRSQEVTIISEVEK